MAEISLQRSRVVCDRLGKGRATLHNDIHDGLMPPPIQIGPRWSAWPSDEIDQIIRARVAGWSKDRLRALVKDLVAKRQTAAPMQGRIAGDGDDEPPAVVRKLEKGKPKSRKRTAPRAEA